MKRAVQNAVRHHWLIWLDMRPGTWQLFNAIVLPFMSATLLMNEEVFYSLATYGAMRAWAGHTVWAAIIAIVGAILLLSRVGSNGARVGLFLASLLWMILGVSIYLAVGLSAVGPPVYITLSIFTGRTFVKSKGYESGVR
jgi:hypothetical protein